MAQTNTRIPALLLSAILAGVVAGTPALAYQGAQDHADNSTGTSSTMKDDMMLEGWRSNDTNKKMGVISSIQNDDQGNPAWVISGFWKMEFATNSASSSGSANGDVSDFHAMMAMVMLNGSAMHSHEISNFTQSEEPTLNSTGNSTTYVGSSIVTMREGPVSDVDTQIVVSQDRVVEIQLDPASLDNHFGDTPIYGLVITHEMINEFMEKTMIQEHMNNATGIMSEMWK